MTLKEMRANKCIQQIDVAKKLGVEQAAVSKWESGKAYPTPGRIVELAKLYGVSEGDIISAITAEKEGRNNDAIINVLPTAYHAHRRRQKHSDPT